MKRETITRGFSLQKRNYVLIFELFMNKEMNMNRSFKKVEKDIFLQSLK